MNTTKPLANALLLIVLLVVQGVSAGTATVPLEHGYSIIEVHGNQTVSMSFWHGAPIATFTGSGHVLALASNGTHNYTVTAFIAPDPVVPADVPRYDVNFSRLEDLVLGLGGILQAQEHPEPYNDSQLRDFIAVEVLKAIDAIKSAEQTTASQQDDLDAIKAGQSASQWPSWLILAAVLALGAYEVWKDRPTRRRPAAAKQGTPAAMEEAPLVLEGEEG